MDSFKKNIRKISTIIIMMMMMMMMMVVTLSSNNTCKLDRIYERDNVAANKNDELCQLVQITDCFTILMLILMVVLMVLVVIML